jgi:hypothetical protein
MARRMCRFSTLRARFLQTKAATCLQIGVEEHTGFVILQEGTNAILELDTIVRGCHLIPVFKTNRPHEPSNTKWLLNQHRDRWSYWNLYSALSV